MVETFKWIMDYKFSKTYALRSLDGQDGEWSIKCNGKFIFIPTKVIL